MSINILHTLLLLVFEIVESLQCIINSCLKFTGIRFRGWPKEVDFTGIKFRE